MLLPIPGAGRVILSEEIHCCYIEVNREKGLPGWRKVSLYQVVYAKCIPRGCYHKICQYIICCMALFNILATSYSREYPACFPYWFELFTPPPKFFPQWIVIVDVVFLARPNNKLAVRNYPFSSHEGTHFKNDLVHDLLCLEQIRFLSQSHLDSILREFTV